MNANAMNVRQLDGEIIQLRLLTRADYPELASTCLDPEIWRHTITKIQNARDLKAYLDIGLEQHARGQATPFVIRLKESGTAVGSTRMAATAQPDTLEIGWTFVASAWHRKGVNTEAKLLLLDHAFGLEACKRVVFKVSNGNQRSAAALASFGARPSLLPSLPRTTPNGDAIGWFELLLDDWRESRALLAARVSRLLE